MRGEMSEYGLAQRQRRMAPSGRLEHDVAEYSRGDFVVAYDGLAAHHGGRTSEQACGRQADGILACPYRDVTGPARAEYHRSRPS